MSLRNLPGYVIDIREMHFRYHAFHYLDSACILNRAFNDHSNYQSKNYISTFWNTNIPIISKYNKEREEFVLSSPKFFFFSIFFFIFSMKSIQK